MAKSRVQILRQYITDESVDLIYLDPPFNSNRDYNMIFRDESGLLSDAQIIAFEDTWHWVVHGKVAGGFRSDWGADAHATVCRARASGGHAAGAPVLAPAGT